MIARDFWRLGGLTIALAVGGALLWGCGEDAVPEDTTCSGDQPIRIVGEVGEVAGGFLRNSESGTLAPTDSVGELTDRRITLDMGEVEFLVAGADEPELRSRRLVFQTNTSDPEGSTLLENLNRRINSGSEEARVLRVVNKPIEEYCDVEEGEICVRFGLDTTSDDELVKDSDPVVHLGLSGTVTIKVLTATRLDALWDVEFGPNVSKFGDTGSGQLTGCFAGQRGNAAAGIEPLDVPGS